jgi:hypothetical protein
MTHIQITTVSVSSRKADSLQIRNESGYHAPMNANVHIPKAPPIVPKEGKGGWGLRGSKAQRREFYEMARQHTAEVIETLIGIVRDDEADNGHRIQAGKEILNRGWGAAPQTHVVEQSMEHKLTMNVDVLRQMSDEEIALYQRMLTRMLTANAEDAEIIEAETPNESASHAPQSARQRRIAAPDGD